MTLAELQARFHLCEYQYRIARGDKLIWRELKRKANNAYTAAEVAVIHAARVAQMEARAP